METEGQEAVFFYYDFNISKIAMSTWVFVSSLAGFFSNRAETATLCVFSR